MIIAFHSSQLNLRGTEIALYDYAFYAEKLLGHKAIIISIKGGNHEESVIKKFQKHFPVFYYSSLSELEDILAQQKAEAMYAIKSGQNDGLIPKNVKNWVHVVFRNTEPHGNVYAYVSEWLAMDQGSSLFVPHIVTRPHHTTDNLRAKLGISENAIVFGRYGGAETFDIRFVRKVVLEVAFKHPDRYFIFMGTNEFGYGNGLFRKKWQDTLFSLFKNTTLPPNIKFLQSTANPLEKQLFINTTDAMLHARGQGESFGLAVAEFSVSNKPVFTFDNPSDKYEKAHLFALGEKAIIYSSASELKEKLMSFNPSPEKDWNAYQSYSPELVMKKFDEVFIKGISS